MKYSDKTLLAYLEGSLDATEAQAIEDAVAEDPTLEARLMVLDSIAAMVQQSFERVPADTPRVDLPVRSPVQHTGGPLRLLAVAASVAVIAVSTTYWIMRPTDLGWAEQAAIYQSLYAPESIATLDNSPEALDAQFSLAEAQLGRSLKRDVLQSLPGLDLKRAQVLSFKGKPLVQIVFADAQGQPFAFCVIRQGEGTPARDVNLAVLNGLATATWARDGYGYMLLGSDPQTALDGELEILTGAFTG